MAARPKGAKAGASRCAPTPSARTAGFVSWLLLVWLSMVPAAGQEQRGPRAETLVLHAHELVYQPAREALPLVQEMISERGSLELRSATNTLVIRDHPSVVEGIRTFLREFDHPPIDLNLEIYILRASRREGGDGGGQDIADLPEPLIQGLGAMVQFNRYQLLAEGELTTREGQPVTMELGGRYAVSFKVGTVLAAKRLRLRDFELVRRTARISQRLLFTSLNLTLRRMQVVGAAAGEASDSGLVVALRCRQRAGSELALGGR